MRNCKILHRNRTKKKYGVKYSYRITQLKQQIFNVLSPVYSNDLKKCNCMFHRRAKDALDSVDLVHNACLALRNTITIHSIIYVKFVTCLVNWKTASVTLICLNKIFFVSKYSQLFTRIFVSYSYKTFHVFQFTC